MWKPLVSIRGVGVSGCIKGLSGSVGTQGPEGVEVS